MHARAQHSLDTSTYPPDRSHRAGGERGSAPFFTPPHKTARESSGSPRLGSLCCANVPKKGPSPHPNLEVQQEGPGRRTAASPAPCQASGPSAQACGPPPQPPHHPARPALSHPSPACCRFFLPTAAPMMPSSSSIEAPARRWSRRDTSEFPKRQTCRGSPAGEHSTPPASLSLGPGAQRPPGLGASTQASQGWVLLGAEGAGWKGRKQNQTPQGLSLTCGHVAFSL